MHWTTPQVRQRTTRALVTLGLAIATLLAPARGDAAKFVQAVRHWSAPDHTRIVVDLSAPVKFHHLPLEGPPRIVVDVDNVVFDFAPEPIPVSDGIVKSIRFGAPKELGEPGRIVVDLVNGRPRYEVFLLAKVDDKPDRLVIDVRGTGTATPGSPLAGKDPSGARVENRIGPDKIGDFLIMVDPGHGGEDAGRRNADGLKEKTLALEYSKALAAEIERRPGYSAALTRTGDYFVPLGKRRAIAEAKGAQLFVSVHFNAAPSTKARGTEIFFVSLKGADDRATRELEEVENSADLIGGLPPTDHATSENIARMLVDLRQSDCVERSQRLAVHMNDHVANVGGVQTRNVKQAGFAVLKQLFIPAALVEVGFLSNKDDVRWVRRKENRDAFVRALADGIVRYCEEVEIPRLGWGVHTVGRGESLNQIAQTYAMTVDTLREANRLDGYDVRPGQKLRVKTP